MIIVYGQQNQEERKVWAFGITQILWHVTLKVNETRKTRVSEKNDENFGRPGVGNRREKRLFD